jgi:predicted nuclease of restriction endonuclease-like (RecB) superfamily
VNFETLLVRIGRIHGSAQTKSAQAINHVLNTRNWLIGAWIVEYEQQGEDRAAYGERLLPTLAGSLRDAGHAGLAVSNLKNFRQIALTWPAAGIRQTLPGESPLPKRQTLSGKSPVRKRQTPSGKSQVRKRQTPSGKSRPLLLEAEGANFPTLARRHQESPALPWQGDTWVERLFASLSFSHLLELSRIDDPLKRAFYEVECLKSGWSLRELKRQRDSMLFERIGLSKDKDALLALSEHGQLVETPATVLRDPYVLEFLGLEPRVTYSESDIEQALLDHLQHFLHELGRDFCFVERQMRITVGGRHHYLDLLFFHRSLRCLVAVELKLGAFEHENAGQMNFYLSYLKDNVARPDENPPVGILLCADKDNEEVHYATAGLPHAVFVSRYLVALPSEVQLARWLREERAIIEAKGVSASARGG